MSNLRVTIGIATYNRADYLKKTLASLSELESSKDGIYEILVVENNCTDHTSQIINQFQSQFGKTLRTLREPKQGLSFVRNRIIRESDADVIAYLDDDVKVDSKWFLALVEAYKKWPDAAVVGGKANLIFENGCPEWLGANERKYLSEVDLGNHPQRVIAEDKLFGLNLSFKKDILNEFGFFRECLGRNVGALLDGEETEVLSKIQKSGKLIYYEPAMLVGHYVLPERCHKKWFLRRKYWRARSILRLAVSQGKKPSFSKGLVLKTLRSLAGLLYQFFVKGPHSSEVYKHLRNIAAIWGEISERLWLFCHAKKIHGR